MRRLAIHARIKTFHIVINNNSTPVRSIRTTTFLAAKASITRQTFTRIKTKKMSSPIDLTQDSGSEESDDDLKLAIAMSLSQPNQSNDSTSTKLIVPDEHLPKAQLMGTGIMGLNRKQMEAERLARQAQLKRKRGDDDISPPPLSRRTRTKLPPSHPGPRKPTSTETGTSSTTTPSQDPRSTTPQAALQYPNGIIKRTWISSHPRTERDVSFSELIDAPNLKSAVLSSFIWDFDWLFPHFRTKETKFVLVMHAQSSQHASLLKADFASIPNIRLTFPPTPSIGCMHSKLLLLFYNTHMRIAIPSANLTSSDWGECGRLENMLFVIDLPLLETSNAKGTENENDTANEQHPRQAQNSGSGNPFYTSLQQFLRAQAVPADVLTRLSTFDFAATRNNNIAFVHSISGSHSDPEIRDTTGRCGLGAAVRGMGLVPRKGDGIQMDYVCSSVGGLTEKFLEGLHAAACGAWESVGLQESTTMRARGLGVGANTTQNGIRGFFKAHISREDRDQDQGTGAEDPLNSSSRFPIPIPAPCHSNLRVYFPSTHTIASSLGGSNAAGTICFERRWWEGAKFPRGVLRDCVAGPSRRGVLMHSKILFVRFVRQEKGEDKGKGEYAGWVYVGSANCSESAWGVLGGGGGGKVKVKDKGRAKGNATKGEEGNGNGGGIGDVKLTCRNWECGVVVPVPVREETTGLGVFESVLPVPMVYPGASFEANTDLEPWFFGECDVAAP